MSCLKIEEKIETGGKKAPFYSFVRAFSAISTSRKERKESRNWITKVDIDS